jgi:hypothetical protein
VLIAASVLGHSENLRFLQKESLKEDPPKLADTPDHQKYNKDKDLTTKMHEVEEASEDDWN